MLDKDKSKVRFASIILSRCRSMIEFTRNLNQVFKSETLKLTKRLPATRSFETFESPSKQVGRFQIIAEFLKDNS